MKLYQIASAYREVMDRVASADGELDDAIEAELDAVEDELDHKIDAIAKVRSELQAETMGLKLEIERLQKRRHALDRKVDRLRDYLATCLERMGRRRVKTPTHTVYLQATPPRVVLDVEPGELPEMYVEWQRKVRLADIGQALKAGTRLPYAHLEQDEKVRVK